MTVRRERLLITDGSPAPRVGDVVRGVIVIAVDVVEVDGERRTFDVLVTRAPRRPQRRQRRRTR